MEIAAKRHPEGIRINAGCQSGVLSEAEAKDLITKVQAAIVAPAPPVGVFWLQTACGAWYGPYRSLVRGDYKSHVDVWVVQHQDMSMGWFGRNEEFTGMSMTDPNEPR